MTSFRVTFAILPFQVGQPTAVIRSFRILVYFVLFVSFVFPVDMEAA